MNQPRTAEAGQVASSGLQRPDGKKTGMTAMQRFALLLACLLGIPVAAIGTGALLLNRPGLQVSVLRGRLPTDTPSTAQSIAVSSVFSTTTIPGSEACRDPLMRERVKTLCHERESLIGMMIASAICAGLSIALLAMIAAAAFIARGSRRRLVLLFGAGRRLVLGILGILVLVEGFVAAITVSSLASAAFGIVPAALVLPIMLGALVGALMTISSCVALTRPARMSELAIDVAQSEQPRLWARVVEIARRLGTAPPKHLILSLQPNFYATGAEMTVVNKSEALQGETLCLSLPMMRIMTSQELAAVIGHELGHFRGQDVAYNLRFAPVYTHMTKALLETGRVKGIAGLPLLPAQAMLGFFLQQFSYAEREIGRQRESEADRAGVTVAGAPALASALMKVAVFTPFWLVEQREMLGLLAQGRLLTNASLRIEAITKLQLASMAESDIVRAAASHRVPHPTDTHPPTTARLLTIGVQPEDAAKDVAFPAEAAIALVDAPEQIEQTLSRAQAQLLALALKKQQAAALAATAGSKT